MVKFLRQHEPREKYGTRAVCIARGTYGCVYSTTKGYAVKITRKDDTEGESVDFLREVTILRSLRHPNILKLLAVYNNNDERVVYMKQASATLHDHIKSLARGNPSTHSVQWYMYQILRAIDHCHRNNIIHRDIKPQNILLFNNGKIQLADFGLARSAVTSGETHTGEVVTLWWRPPELLLGKKQYSYKVDIWSAGVILLTMLLKRNPFQGDSEAQELNLIFQMLGTPTEQDWPGVTKLPNWRKFGTFARKKLKLSPIELDLVYKLLSWEPKRIGAAEALQHPYFDPVRNEVDQKYPEITLPPINTIPTRTAFSPRMRRILFEWLWELKVEYKFRYNTLFTAYNIFDRYLELQPEISKDQVQGYGIAALMIAIKLHEIITMTFEDCCYISDHTYVPSQLREFELNILKALDYQITNNPYNYALKNTNTVTVKMMIYFTAMYLNYEWATSWTAQEFVQTLYAYLSGSLTNKSRERMDAYFNSLEGPVGEKIRGYDSD
jgi:serine/threonine protein kinase